MIVHTLIDSTTNSWNSHLVNTLFHLLDAAAITKIGLSLRPHIDNWIWKEEQDKNLMLGMHITSFTMPNYPRKMSPLIDNPFTLCGKHCGN